MMSRIVMRRELNRFNCVLPFCYKLCENKIICKTKLNSSEHQIQRHLKTTDSSEQYIESNRNNNSLEENPFYGKYLDKIKEALNQKTNELNDSNNSSDSPLNGLNDCKHNSKVEQKIETNERIECQKSWKQTLKSSSEKPTNSLNQSLDDILKLDLLRHKTAEEITEIWNSYHRRKDCIYGVVPSKTYDQMFAMSSKYKTFLFPIPRTDRQDMNRNGYEFVLSQIVGHKCFFTPLVSYQTHRELAPICLTISYFPELQNEKQIVLMSGEYDSNVLNAFEAQCLANQLQWYYSADHSLRQSILLHKFNFEPNLFDHMDLIRELENNLMGIGLNQQQSKH